MAVQEPGAVQLFREMGTTTDVTRCDFCRRDRLPETVVLLVHSVDGELLGYKHACDPCASEAGRRAAQTPDRGRRGKEDPSLRKR
jgi:hypothetical protein